MKAINYNDAKKDGTLYRLRIDGHIQPDAVTVTDRGIIYSGIHADTSMAVIIDIHNGTLITT